MASRSEIPPLPQEDPLESSLHDLANAVAAARSYAEVLLLRARALKQDPSVAESLVREIARLDTILKDVRRRTYRAGDVLRCRACNHTFVHRRGRGKPAECRRCRSPDVERWQTA